MNRIRRSTELAKIAAAMIMAVGRSGLASRGREVCVLVGRRLREVDDAWSDEEVVIVLSVFCIGPGGKQ